MERRPRCSAVEVSEAADNRLSGVGSVESARRRPKSALWLVSMLAVPSFWVAIGARSEKTRGGIRVSVSLNNCEVDVTNMQSTRVRENLEPLVKEHTEGVRAVRWTCASRAILEYDNHRATVMPCRKLLAILPDQCGREVRAQLVRRDRPSNVPRQRLQMPPLVSFNRAPPQNKAPQPTESAEEYWARKRTLMAAAGVPPQQRSPWPLVPVASPSFGFQPLFLPPQM